MAIFTEKGELIVVKDDRKHTERQEPMVIKLSQLESRMVYEMLQCSLHSCLLNINTIYSSQKITITLNQTLQNTIHLKGRINATS